MVRRVKLQMIRDIRRYKGRMIMLHVKMGRYRHIEAVVFARWFQSSVLDLIEISGNTAQTGWDPVGGFALANALQNISENAKNLNQTFVAAKDDASYVADRLLPSIKELLDSYMPRVNKVVDEGIDVNLGFDFNSIIKLFESPISATIVSSLIYLFIEIIERKYEIGNLIYVKSALAIFVCLKVGKSAFDLFSSWLVPVSSDVAQTDWTDWLQVTVQGVIFFVFGCTMDFSSLSTAVKTLFDSVGCAVKLQDTFTAISDWFKKLINMVCEKFNIEVWDWLKPQDVKIRQFMTRTNALMAEYSANPMAVGLQFAEDSTRLLMEINDYMGKIPLQSKNQPVVLAIKNLQDKMQILHRNVVDAGLNLGERNEPAFIPVAGPPEAGKTYLSDFIAQELSFDMARTPEEVIDARRNWKTNVYVWPTDNKHHDQYKGEPIVTYPDLFCQTDAEGQPSEASSIVYLVGGQPIQLPAAELTKKQRLYFVSQVIMACTNVTYIHQKMFKSVRNPDAVKRRMDAFGWYMWVNPAYIQRDEMGNVIVDPSTNRIRGYEHDDEMYGRIDKNLIPELAPGDFPPDLWFFRRLNFSKGEFMDNKVYTYKNFVILCKQHVRRTREAGEHKRRNLNARAEILVQEKLNELGQLNPQIDEVEYIECPKREVSPMPEVLVPEYMLAVEARGRIVRKDKIDSYRLREMQKKHGPLNDDEEVFEDALMEEEVTQAQTDDFEARYNNLVASEIRFQKFSEIPIIDAYEIYDNIDEERGKFWTNFKFILKSLKLTPFKHARLKEIFKTYNIAMNCGDMIKFDDDHHIERGKGKLHLSQTQIYFYLNEAIQAVDIDPELSSFSKYLSTRCLVELSCRYVSFDDIDLRYLLMKSMIKEPFLLSVYQSYDYLRYFIKKITKPIRSVVSSTLSSIYYSREFSEMYKAVWQNIGIYGLLGILSVGNGFLLAKNALKVRQIRSENAKNSKTLQELSETRKEIKRLRTQGQSSWVVSEGVKATINKHMDNFCGLYVVIHMGDKVATRHPCNLVFLGGKTAIIVDHAIQALREIQERVSKHDGHYVELVIVPYVSISMEKSTERFRLEDVEFDGNDELSSYDLGIIKFKHAYNRPYIFHLIPPVKCMEYLSDKSNLEGIFIERTTDSNLAFVGPEKRIPVRFNFGHSLGFYDSNVSIYGENVPLKSYNYQTLVMKGKDEIFMTHAGYCTSPGFLIDDRKNFCTNMMWKQAQQPWLCYLHTSLQGSVPNGAPIFREMFEKWIDELSVVNLKPVVDAINENIEVYSEITKEEFGLKDGEQACDLEVQTVLEQIDSNHMSIASMNHKFFQPFKSEIKRSPLFGIDDRTRYPAKMGVCKLKDGTLVDTMLKAREPYGVNNALLNGKVIDEIINQAMSRVMSDSSVPVLKELLSLDQVLYGDGAYKLNSVNWNSSIGFYLRLMKDNFNMDWKGKRWMLNSDGVLTDQAYNYIKRLFDYYENKLINGERIYGVNIDNIKDELLKKEKVARADSRLFCTNDMIHLLLCKRYMGAFAGWIYENRISNGIAIGVNPLSDEWTAIATSLVNNSPDCIFLDHAKFDKRQMRIFMKCVVILMDMYYGDKGSINSRARYLLFEDIIDSIHVTVKDGKLVFYCWRQGNTSGNFLTAILNSNVNICYVYTTAIFAWLEHKHIDPWKLTSLPSNPVDQALKTMVLGDDVVASIKKDLLPGVNFNTIKDVALRYLNLDITDELKLGGDIPDFRLITEGSFLGRGFVPLKKHGRVRFIAPLRKYSILERVQWIKGIYDPLIEVEKMESVFLEMSLYSKAEFDSVVKRYAPACKKAYGIYPKFTDYECAQNHVLTLSEYKYSFYDFLESDNYEGIDISFIIGKTSLESQKMRSKSEFKVVETECVFDFDLGYNTRSTMDSVSSVSEVSVPPDLKSYVCSTSIDSKCSRDQNAPLALRYKVNSEPVVKASDFSKDNVSQSQMDNTVKTDFESAVSVEEKAVTTFYEAAVTEEGTSSRSTNELSTYVEKFDDIKSFLLRPVLIANGTWAAGAAINQNLASGNIASYLSSVTMWADKIRGFNLIRGDFLIKVQINATPFHQGKLLLHYLPNYSNFVAINPGYNNFKNEVLIQKIQHPHLEVDCRKTSVVMRIPYIAPTPWYAVKEGYYDWGTWWLDVFSPLLTGTLGEQFVDYLVYGWFENVELNAPTVPQMSNSEVVSKKKLRIRRRGGEVPETAENQGPITQGLRKASKIANILNEIPVISEFSKPVEWVTNLLSGVTSVLGWSKPRELTGQTVVAQQLLRYAGTCDGPDLAYPGGVSSLNRLETIDYGSFTTEDEMSLNYLYRIPYYAGEFTWAGSAGQGTSLLNRNMSPLSFLGAGANGAAGHTWSYEWHVPFTYLARMHKFWRGGLVLTLKFIKTQMHSGRLQVVWVPCNLPNVVPGIISSSFNKRAIIDIRTEDTVSLELPYLLYSDYASTTPITPTQSYSGQFDIKVLNDLRAPETCSQDIRVQWFISAAEDFELAVPGQQSSGAVPFVSQMDGSELLRDSVKQGMDMPATEIGGVQTINDPVFHASRCIGEKTLSIKSYLLRNSVIQGMSPSTFVWSANPRYFIDPYFISCASITAGTGTLRSCNFGGDHFSLLAPMYAYMRGSMRYTFVDGSANSEKLYSNILPSNGFFSTQPTSVALAKTSTFGNLVSPAGPTGVYPLEPCNIQDQSAYVYQHVPYYNRLPMSLTSFYEGTSTPTNDPGRPVSTLYITTGEAFSDNIVFQRSVGDDFQLMFFTGCPPLLTSYT